MRAYLAILIGCIVLFLSGAKLAQSQVSSVQAQAILNYVNSLRAKHRAPPLAFNADMSSFSQNWATYLASTNQFMHSSSQYGENLAAMQLNRRNTTQMYVRAIELWYGEIQTYRNLSRTDKNRFNYQTGHFTALVWKSSTHVGMGMGVLNQRAVLMMTFWPPGNVAGSFTSNIFLPSC